MRTLPKKPTSVHPHSCVFILFTAFCVTGTGFVSADEQKKPDPIGAVVSRLESKDFRVRQAATRLLMKRGKPAIGPLVKRVQTGRLELAVRAMSIFEAAYVGKDMDAALAADAALEDLATSGRQELAEHALGVLDRNRATRTRLAIANLRRLGAATYDYEPAEGPDGFRPLDMDRPYLVIDEEWTGGADGLKYVQRLAGSDFGIYLIDGLKAPEKAILKLMSAMQAGAITRRGPAMLGIKGGVGGACRVTDVVEGKAAHKAGLREGDIILEMNGRPVVDFTELVDMLREIKAYESVTLKVDRDLGREPEIIKVQLGKWRPKDKPDPKPAVDPAVPQPPVPQLNPNQKQ